MVVTAAVVMVAAVSDGGGGNGGGDGGGGDGGAGDGGGVTSSFLRLGPKLVREINRAPASRSRASSW